MISFPRVLTLVVSLAFISPLAHAGVVQWTIDSTQSSLKLTIPVTNPVSGEITWALVHVNASLSGNTWVIGSTAPLAGKLQTNYTENLHGRSIQFLENPLGQLVGFNSGNYRPNPATFQPANTNEYNPAGQFTGVTTAAGAYGAQVFTLLGAGSIRFGYFNLRDLSYDAHSPLLLLSGNSFDAAGVSFGISQGTLAVDGVRSFADTPLQYIPDSLAAFPPFLAQNATSVGTITDVDELTRKLTLPISVPFTLDLGGGFVLPGTMSGQIVAFALVPEPSTLVLAGAGLASILVWRRQRGRNRRT